MSEITSVSEKNYTSDKKFYEGQTRQDTRNADMVLFDFADRNHDEILTADEIRRYNSPVLIVNASGGNSRLINSDAREEFLEGEIRSGVFQIDQNEQDFYAGLKREEVKSPKFTAKFDLIDTDKDGEISEKEMTDIQEIEDRYGFVKELINSSKILTGITSLCSAAVTTGLALRTKAGRSISKSKFGVLFTLGVAVTGALIGTLPYKSLSRNLSREYLQILDNYSNHPYAKDKFEKDRLLTYIIRG